MAANKALQLMGLSVILQPQLHCELCSVS